MKRKNNTKQTCKRHSLCRFPRDFSFAGLAKLKWVLLGYLSKAGYEITLVFPWFDNSAPLIKVLEKVIQIGPSICTPIPNLLNCWFCQTYQWLNPRHLFLKFDFSANFHLQLRTNQTIMNNPTYTKFTDIRRTQFHCPNWRWVYE